MEPVLRSSPPARRAGFARTVCVLVGLLGVAAPVQAASARPADATPPPPSSAAPLEQLKRDYIECERLAQRAVLDGSSGMSCSVVYERLKSEAFGGSFEALNRWWQAERSRINTR